jgi:hypothetical protein
VIARGDTSLVAKQLDVKLGGALVRVESVPLWTMRSHALLELVPQRPLLPNHPLVRVDTVVLCSQRVPYLRLTLLTLLSHLIALQSVLTDLRMLVNH